MGSFLWGLWNGITAWPLLIIHVFGGWTRFPVFDILRNSGWYQFGFLMGSGSPFLGMLGRHQVKTRYDGRKSLILNSPIIIGTATLTSEVKTRNPTANTPIAT